MSLFNPSGSDTLSDIHSQRRQNSASSSFGPISSSRRSSDLLNPASIRDGPTPGSLYRLQVDLDHQCLRNAVGAADPSTGVPVVDVDRVVETAISLSSSLSHARHPGTFHFQEIQLRALTASLALLHYHGVESLAEAKWDELKRTNISGLFKRVAFQKPSTLAEEIRYSSNVYVLQLASQYMSFIDRGESRLPSIVGPVANVLFATVAVVGTNQALRMPT